MEFGRKVGLLLKERKITQTKFAEEIDWNKVSISQYIKGSRTPPVEFINKTIEYFSDVDLNWLMRDDASSQEIAREEGSTYQVPKLPETIISNIEINLKELKALLSQK
jgi:transcriptional regulator with XRE-family HTH domain